ncbi:MAG: PQQ-like beta-propeller repeat protein [Planctomycetia bacterium]|nr:PQQ-like beta-propeller repeat protein [Planctomycetia bacterium]
MHRFVFGFSLTLTLALTLSAADWNQFRGPTGDGHAEGKPPTEWDAKKNVTWRKELPGNGWSSPVVVSGKIYLTTAVPLVNANRTNYSLRVLCLDAKTGNTEWDKEVFIEDGKTAPAPHRKNSHASPTPFVEDGKVYVHFGHMGTACLNAKDGSKVWATQEIKYVPVHGNGGSPIVVGKHLIFCADGFDKQSVVALDKTTGKSVWQTPRKAGAFKGFSFCTPLLITVNDQEQVIAPGSNVVMSLDPKTGKELWRVTYDGYSVVPKPVYANGLVYLSTGYDSPRIYAIKPDGKGDVTKTHVAWTARKNAPNNPSPLAVGDALYVVSDSGVLSCLDAKTGAARWNERIGKAYSASLVFAGGHIYAMSEDGTATVFKPGASYDPVSTNKMNEKSLASFAVDGNTLFIRTEKALYRIEKK